MKYLSSAILAVASVALCVHARSAAEEAWTSICDFDVTYLAWTTESGPSQAVRLMSTQPHSGKRCLAIDMAPMDTGAGLRQAWQAGVAEWKWAPESRIRFWVKGDAAAGKPHGGIIFVEYGGKKGGGDSHWFLPIPPETYATPEWKQVVSPPLREAVNAEWAPDASGAFETDRVVRLLFVAQQDAPDGPKQPFTFFFDDLEASALVAAPVRMSAARVEEKPAHITPIWRGFKGRAREHPAQVTFSDVTGWQIAQYGDALAEMVRSEEEPCYEDLRHQAKVTYSSRGPLGHFELVPPAPIPVAGPFNAACAWVYGNNWSWVPDPTTPQVCMWVRLVDSAGQRHRLSLGPVSFKFYGLLSKRLHDDPSTDAEHEFWGGPADGIVHFPASIEAIEVHQGLNSEPRTIYIESVALYQDDMALPAFKPELIENLPFPTTPDTILPTLQQPAKVTFAREDTQGTTSYVFCAQGDESILWRYTPTTGTLSDLTVEVAGRPPFTPCAGAGPALRLGDKEYEPDAAELTRERVATRELPDGVETTWRFSCGNDSAQFRLLLKAKGKSMTVEWHGEDAMATWLRLGRVRGAAAPKVVRVPYLNISSQGPAVLVTGDTFMTALLDWYNTESSAFYANCQTDGDTAAINGGSAYYTLTDGARNPLGERLFINVSSRFDEVLPNIPNPPSTQADVLRTHLYCHLGGLEVGRFDTWVAMWRDYHRKGIEQVLVTHHEDAWTNGADVGQGGQEYTMCIEAAPEVGDEKMITYCRAMREMGYFIGLYENFTDYNPLGKSWDARNAQRDASGEMTRVWPPTYAIRPLKALEMALDYPRRVHEKFGTNTAYRDCHTAYPPWGQVDFQAGTPGAGKFSTNFRAWGALLMDGHKAYGGPIFSEGGHHWFSAGLVDGNYAQIWMPDAVNYPLLLDFDLLKLHPLEADISMTPHWGWGPGGVWQGLAATIAYGHIGFQPFNDLDLAVRYYYLLQQLQSRYVMIPATEVQYHADGVWRDSSGAIKADALRANQIRVRYASGLAVAVNYNPEGVWRVDLEGRAYDLGAFSWAAQAPDGFQEYCTISDGRRIAFVDSPAYLFADAAGAARDFGPIATDGIVIVRKDDPRGLKIIPLGGATSVRINAPESARIEAFSNTDDRLGEVASTRAGAQVTFQPMAGAEYYIIPTAP